MCVVWQCVSLFGNLDSGLSEVNFQRQFLATEHVRVVSLLEHVLQLVQLEAGERRAIATLFALHRLLSRFCAPFTHTYMYTRWPKKQAANICLYGRQILTEFRHFSPAHSVENLHAIKCMVTINISPPSLHYLVNYKYVKSINISMKL